MVRVYGKRRLSGVKWIGTSSGAIAALISAMGLDACVWKDLVIERWGGIQGRCGGLLNADDSVGRLISDVLATDPRAFVKLTGVLHVSVTKCLMRNVVINQWHSNEHVCRVVLASCFIPIVFLRPILQRRWFIIDGGFSHNHPTLDDNTVLVSPTRSIGSNIMPESKARFRDIIGAPKVDRSNQLFDEGVYNGTCFFAPSLAFGLVHHEGVPQSPFGRLYYFLIKHKACMFVRVCCFWAVLLTQVLCLPLCCIFSCPAIDTSGSAEIRQSGDPPLSSVSV